MPHRCDCTLDAAPACSPRAADATEIARDAMKVCREYDLVHFSKHGTTWLCAGWLRNVSERVPLCRRTFTGHRLVREGRPLSKYE
jgi:hypothetical protein